MRPTSTLGIIFRAARRAGIRALLGLLLGLLLLPLAGRAQASQGQVADSTELRVLRQFYYATGGDQWTNHPNWPATPAAWAGATLADAATWYGVGVSAGDVTSLYLGSNHLVGQLPVSFGELRQLGGLSLSFNQLSGPLPASMAQQANMNQCLLAYNQFSGELTGLVDHWYNLQSLDLGHNQLTGPVPGALGGLPRLHGVGLNDNQLSGPLPAALGTAGTLWGLNLSNNHLTGGVPEAWRGLGSLRQLFLGDNQLSGALSDELADLSALDYLELENNRFTGTIPTSFTRFTNLYRLDLRSNQLTGSIPANLRATFLLLSNNQLSGELPASYGTTSNYQILLEGNNLTRIPYFAQPLGYPNLQLGLSNNYLEFDSYEPSQVTPGQYQFWDYGQRSRPGDTLSAVAPAAAHLDGRIGGAHNRYQWQRLVGGQWVDMPGQTQPELHWASVTPAEAGTYRTRVTNEWVVGVVLYSPTRTLDVTPYLAWARNLPDDANRAAEIKTPPPAPDAQAPAPADVNYVRTWVPRVALTSAEAAPTPQAGRQAPAPAQGLLREQWNGLYGYSVQDIPLTTAADELSYLPTLEGPTDYGDHYADRVSGYLRAPQTGAYTFWIAGDNDCGFWLSPDQDPAHKQLLARSRYYAAPREWTKTPAQQSAPVQLVAGQRYYLEVVHLEDAGGDNMAVTWRLPDGTQDNLPIAGQYLSPATPPPVGPVTWEQWRNLPGQDLNTIPLGTPADSRRALPSLEGPTNIGNQYGARLSAYLVAPQTGEYSFWVAGDDASALWLSPDATPAHAQRVAYCDHYTTAREWSRDPTQHSGPVRLVAGQRYYLEVRHKQDGGEDHVAAAWTLPDGTFEGPIAGSHLAASGAPEPAWTVAQASKTTQYLDGLGRPVQTVRHQASPQGRDLVQPQAYDGLGREPRQYLPYAADTTRSAANFTTTQGLHYRALTEQQAFYLPTGQQGPPNPATDPTLGVARTGVAYAETAFEASPLNRVVAQGAPGEAWRLTGGHVTEREERPNTAEDSVAWFRPGYDPQSLDPGYQGFYPAGELWGVEVMDPHGPAEPGAHGYKSIEWKDKLGQVVGKQVEAARAGRTDSSRWLRTAYAYDDFGHLRFVLQPEATRRVLAGGTWPAPLPAAARPFLFHYRYDGRGRQIAKQVPGQDGETLVVYDQLDRPVLSQDAQQRTRKEWSWTKYDALGRVIMSGLTTRADTAGQVSLQATATADTATGHQYEQRTADAGRYPRFYTTDQSFPKLGQQGFGPGQVLSATYYDDYDFNQDGQPDVRYDASQDGQFAAGQAPVADAQRTTGMTTRTSTRVLGVAEGDPTQAAWLTTTTFYDERARPVQVQTTNARKGTDLLTTQLDFVGQVVQSVATHQGPSHAPLTVAEFFRYDHAGRLLSTRQQLPGEARAARLDSVSYNEIGQVTRKTLGTGRLTQEVDYAYNIRGWLTSLNNPYAPDPRDLFNLSLHYEAGFTKGYEQYGGNLTGQTWRGRDGVQRAQGYVYDPMNRLLQGDFVARTVGASPSAGAWTQELDNYRLSFVSYDDNGNIATLRRRGLLQAGTSRQGKQYGAVDNLRYAYQGNRLQAVDDAVSGNQLPQPASYHGAPTSLAGDFQEAGVKQGQEYLYDANGNLTADKNKGLTGIAYNHLNLPRLIHFGQGADSVVFRYAASGQKVAKLVYQTGKPVLRTDYLGPYQYEQDSLKFFPHAEGRVLRFVQYDAARQPTVRYQREYTIKDHLGNLRLAYRAGQVRTLLATLEQDATTHQRESQQFDSLSVSAPVALATTLARSGQYAARLNAGGSAPQPLGPLTQLGVQQGDTLTVSAYGLYPQAQQHGFLFSLGSFLAGLFHPAQAPPPGFEASRRKDLPLLQVGVAAGLASIPQLSGGVPQAYLRVLVFNRDSALVSQQSQQLTQAAQGNYERLRVQLVLPQDGYVTAYVGSQSDVDVFFDDVSLEHRAGLQVQENQYDPWGLSLAGLDYSAPGIRGLNNYRFNGKENQLDLGLNWNHHDWRFFDYQLGRWHVVDPKVEDGQEVWTPYAFGYDNAVRFNDPDGNCPTCITALAGAAIGAIVGAGIEAGTQLYQNGGHVSDWHAVGGAALQGGVTGGLAGLTGGTSLLAVGAAGAVSNVAGGAARNVYDGKPITVGSVAKDAAIGTVAGVGGALAGRAVKAVASRLRSAESTVVQASSKSKSIAEQAEALISKNGGKNRVTIRSEGAKMEVDLAGEAHYSKSTGKTYDTPHTKISPRNTNAPGTTRRYNTSENHAEYSNTTQQDIRTVRRYLERK